MNKAKLQEYAQFAEALALRAGETMLTYFRAPQKETSWKSDNSPVTIADTQINDMVIEQVQKTYPDHGVLGEEAGFNQDETTVWVVDPIDGTAPYDLGMPAATFCLALVVAGEVMVSVVHDPFSQRLFYAVRGNGARLNGKKFMCKQDAVLSHRYAFVPAASQDNPHAFEPFIQELKLNGSKVLFLPSFTYLATLVLEGSASGVLMAYGSPWDAAAISLVAEEAGAVASDLAGNKRLYNQWGDGFMITNAAAHDYYVAGVKHARSRN